MPRKNEVGFSQRIRLEWLEYTSELVNRGYSPGEISLALEDLLSHRLSVGGTGARTNRDKTVTILMRTWTNFPPRLKSLREDGLHLLQRLPLKDHLTVHWGMCIAVYPFWGQVAEVVGRLLRLQGVVAANLVQRRLREQMGERETVSRATRRVLRSYIDWGIISETGRKGVYQRSRSVEVSDRQLAVWLTEATFFARAATSAPMKELISSPALFPFAVDKTLLASNTRDGRLQYTRQSLDDGDLSLVNNEKYFG